ncbi:MAG: hypothetical protein GY797_04495, partial [Deltaproteobacteria bacterium]|nr:hypothetical protein [Deltaproteobacteria bacterium]
MKGCYKTWVKTVFFSGWGILVLWNFFRSFSFVNLMEILLNGAMLLILLLFFTALGRRGFCSTNISFASFAEECCFSFGLGTAISIFLIIGLAALGLLYKLLIILLVLGLFLLVYREARDICIRGYQAFLAAFSQKKPFINIVFLLFIGFAALVTFLAAATPPYFYDALVYHLAVPQKYLLHHGFRYFPRHHFSNYSLNLSMLFTVAMSFSGGMLAKLISWSFAPMTALAVYAFVTSRWGSQMAMTSATILFL